MDLTHAGLADFENLADLAQIQLPVVVERQHQPLALGQSRHGVDQCLKARAENVRVALMTLRGNESELYDRSGRAPTPGGARPLGTD